MKRIDSHTHICENAPEKLLRQAHGDYHYDRINVVSIPCDFGPLNNLECLTVKAMEPEYAYVCGGMVYTPKLERTAEGHARQLELMIGAGFDGWKILESKPSEYRKIRLPLDGEVFKKAFDLAEEIQLPIVWHAGDPATFWSEKTAPEFAVRNGWLCVGEGFPSLKQIYTQVENVFKAHPNLNATMAHLFFTSDDRKHAERLLDTFPNLSLDITPGSEMYGHFMADPDGWREFFGKYRKRLIYGSDMTENTSDCVFGSQKAIVDLVMKTLTTDEKVDISGITGNGIALPDDVLEEVFYGNYERLMPAAPKRISRHGIEAYAEWLMPCLEREDQRKCEDLVNRIIGLTTATTV